MILRVSDDEGAATAMLSKIAKIVGDVASSALGVVGVRVGTEEPRHSSRQLTDAVEIRRYEPRIAAETTVRGAEDEARSEGFRRLAGYIFGRNSTSTKVAMTAPVSQGASSSQKIAMTAPVSTAGDENGWVIRFFMPSKWTMATLPVPDDGRVRLVEVPAETIAALRFSGSRDADAVAAKSAELLKVLADNDIDTLGEPVSWFYDPPWTLPALRRNEVVVPIKDA